MKNIISNYFEFKNRQLNNLFFSEFKGWNGLLIQSLELPKNLTLNNQSFFSEEFDISNKEKIIVVTNGEIEISLGEKKYLLKKFDALNTYGNFTKYNIKSLNLSQIFIISAENLKPQTKEPIFFNFIKDITPKDIWGGQCLSRIFFGDALNLVLFDLKPGFKFDDKGHYNEQITWVIDGEMDFYINNLKKKLYPSLGVDIGSHEIHGGISNGAIGFDAFYPKRQEQKYK